jgi:hypothetical protein
MVMVGRPSHEVAQNNEIYFYEMGEMLFSIMNVLGVFHMLPLLLLLPGYQGNPPDRGGAITGVSVPFAWPTEVLTA